MKAKIIITAVVLVGVAVLVGWLVVLFSGFAGTRIPRDGLSNTSAGNDSSAACQQSCGDFAGADKQECLQSCETFTNSE